MAGKLCNLGKVDSIFRVIIGVVGIYLGFMDNPILSPSLSKTIIGIVGIILGVTGILRFCPIYLFAGIRTDKKEAA